MFYVSLFSKFVKVRWRAQMEYPAPFLMGVFAQWVGYGAQYAAMWLMVTTFGTMAGWKPMEVMFLYAMNILSYALAASLMLNVCNTLPEAARSGGFDDILLKPVNSLIYSLSTNISTSYASHIALSIAVMAASLHGLGIAMAPAKILWLAVSVAGSAMIHLSAMILTAAPSLVFIGSKGWSFLYWDMEEFIHYPVSIYGRPLQILLTFILPYAFIAFYPAQFFLSIDDTLMFPAFFQFLSPVVGLCMLGIAALVWHRCVNRYESTGS